MKTLLSLLLAVFASSLLAASPDSELHSKSVNDVIYKAGTDFHAAVDFHVADLRR